MMVLEDRSAFGSLKILVSLLNSARRLRDAGLDAAAGGW